VRFVTIEGAAHSIHWEKPAETAAVITEFLG
jgi:pimeloyl-ACP methyl ester carboxylesterase